MERFIALLTWVALAAVLIAAFVVRHEPPRPNVQQKLRRAGPNDRARGS
jgi:hypothetical protein